MGLTEDATFILQMMVASDNFYLMFLDISLNPIRDDGFENILQAIRANPNKKMRVLLADHVDIGPESALRISHYLKVTVARPTILPLLVNRVTSASLWADFPLGSFACQQRRWEHWCRNSRGVPERAVFDEIPRSLIQ